MERRENTEIQREKVTENESGQTEKVNESVTETEIDLGPSSIRCCPHSLYQV